MDKEDKEVVQVMKEIEERIDEGVIWRFGHVEKIESIGLLRESM